MNEWSPPASATPQDYPGQPKDGIGALVKRVRDNAVEMRDRFNNLLKQAGIRARPGMVTSTDFDGDGVDLGTRGWMLGAVDGGPSFLVLNGVDVYADLTAKAATLAAQVADLASRVTWTASLASFNTGSLPNDATFHNYGAGIPITISVPTGKLVVTVGCGQATISPGTGGSVIAEATFSLSDGSLVYGDISARGFVATPTISGGASLAVQRAFVVTPGTYTITGQMRAWSAGSAAGAVTFQQPFLTVQVTG